MVDSLAMERTYSMPDLATEITDGGMLPYSVAKKWTAYSVDCIGGHRWPAQPLAERQSWLCVDCTDGLRRNLFTLSRCWGFLGQLLQRGPGKQGERSGSNENAAAPLDLDVADLRRQITAWCWSMVEHVLEDQPGASAPHDVTTPGLLEWVARWHVFYIATHPQESFPLAMIEEVRDMVRRVRARAFPDGIKRSRVNATCEFWPLREDGLPDLAAEGPCGGQMWAVLRDGADPVGSAIICEDNPSHVIPESEWLGLLKMKLKRKAQR